MSAGPSAGCAMPRIALGRELPPQSPTDLKSPGFWEGRSGKSNSVTRVHPAPRIARPHRSRPQGGIEHAKLTPVPCERRRATLAPRPDRIHTPSPSLLPCQSPVPEPIGGGPVRPCSRHSAGASPKRYTLTRPITANAGRPKSRVGGAKSSARARGSRRRRALTSARHVLNSHEIAPAKLESRVRGHAARRCCKGILIRTRDKSLPMALMHRLLRFKLWEAVSVPALIGWVNAGACKTGVPGHRRRVRDTSDRSGCQTCSEWN